jgi:hypothetical protein
MVDLSSAISLVADHRTLVGGHVVLPDEFLVGDLRADVADRRTHVAVEQLEPGLGELVGELVGVLVELAWRSRGSPGR